MLDHLRRRSTPAASIRVRQSFRRRCLGLVAVIPLFGATALAQEADPWAGWSVVEVGGGAAVRDGDRYRLRPAAGGVVRLAATERLGDGSVRVTWRADDAASLWLVVRGSRIRLAGPTPPGAIVGADGVRSDADGTRQHTATVRLRGAVLEVSIDDSVRSVALDPRALSGVLAIEASGTATVELAAPAVDRRGTSRWQTVLDGKQPIDAARWEQVPGGSWQIEDGHVVGSCAKSEPRHGILLSKFEVDDFAARIVYRAVAGNSGFYFRSERVDAAVGVHGFQAEIDAIENAGMLYETGGRARVQVPPAERVERAFRKGGWNEMLVVAAGRRVEVYVNGVRMTRLVDDPGRLAGRIGIQLHGGQDMRVEIESVELLQPAATAR